MTDQQHTTFPFYMATWYRKSPYYLRTVEAGFGLHALEQDLVV